MSRARTHAIRDRIKKELQNDGQDQLLCRTPPIRHEEVEDRSRSNSPFSETYNFNNAIQTFQKISEVKTAVEKLDILRATIEDINASTGEAQPK
jgi:hypothetical protein